MADDNVVDLHHSHTREALDRAIEISKEHGGFKQIVIIGVTGDEQTMQLTGHDGDPRPHQLIGAMRDQEHSLLHWLDAWNSRFEFEDSDNGA